MKIALSAVYVICEAQPGYIEVVVFTIEHLAEIVRQKMLLHKSFAVFRCRSQWEVRAFSRIHQISFEQPRSDWKRLCLATLVYGKSDGSVNHRLSPPVTFLRVRQPAVHSVRWACLHFAGGGCVTTSSTEETLRLGAFVYVIRTFELVTGIRIRSARYGNATRLQRVLLNARAEQCYNPNNLHL